MRTKQYISLKKELLSSVSAKPYVEIGMISYGSIITAKILNIINVFYSVIIVIL